MMRGVAVTLVLFLDLLSVGRGEGGSSCKHPQGYDGESYIEGCLKNTCKASVWRTSMDGSLCCYNGELYQKNTTIASTLSEDGCFKATIDCGEEGQKAKLILHTENFCEDQKGCGEDSKTKASEDFSTKKSPLMFLGPGRGSNGISEVFSLPTHGSSLASATCTVPTYPLADIHGSVAFVHGGYLQICGGHSRSGGSQQSSCYQLKDSAWVATAPLLVAREDPASVMLQDGSVLVSGGSDGPNLLTSTEVLTASANWTPTAIELPSGRYGHCMLQLTSGQLFLHGGWTDPRPTLKSKDVGDTYISTVFGTWVAKASSQHTRSFHACSEHAGYIWLGGGRDVATTEIYELSTNTWRYGPDLPNYDDDPGEFLSHAGVLIYAGGYENKHIFQLNTEQNGWIKIGEMSQKRSFFPALSISGSVWRGVRQVTPPPSELMKGRE